MKDLKQCRQEIDSIDEQLIALFEKRMKVCEDVIKYKLEHDLPIFQSEREKEVIIKNVNRIQENHLKSYAQLFIKDMMNISKSYQASFLPFKNVYKMKEPHYQNVVVGYPGVSGSFSCQALETFFGKDVRKKNYEQFHDVFEALKNDEIDYGIVPLENSSTGAIFDNYDAMRDYQFYIVGEQSLSISQHLLGIQGSCKENITHVYSHPQGLLQSSQFLSAHPHMKGEIFANTALAAQYVASQGNIHFAAIASKEAAQVYGLEVLQDHINDLKNNVTRFIVFSKELEYTPSSTCISVMFALTHEVGTLCQIIQIINNHQMNMLRIESRPLKETPWQYYFYVDFEGNLQDQNIIQALEEMKAYTKMLRILGNYEKKES